MNLETPAGNNRSEEQHVPERDSSLHPVEGRGPSRRVRRAEWRLLMPLAIAFLIAGAVVMYFLGGWAAAAVGGVLIAVYYLVGWSPEIGAALLRRKAGEDEDGPDPHGESVASGPKPGVTPVPPGEGRTSPCHPCEPR